MTKLGKAIVGIAMAGIATSFAQGAAWAGFAAPPEATSTATYLGRPTDRVGAGDGSTSLSPDGVNDVAISLHVAYAGAHTMSAIFIHSSSVFSQWNTYPSDGIWAVGVTAPSTGSALLNSYDSELAVPFNDSRDVWAYIADDGSLAVENRVYATVCFDGGGDACTRAEVLLDTDGDLDDDGYTPPADCNDNHAAANPGMPEIPDDNFDNNCDGISLQTYFRDADGDQYGDPNNTVAAGSQPTGYLSYPQDCDDTNAAIHPYQGDVPDNNVDENCDGKLAKTYYVDVDQDGYGGTSTEVRDELEPGWSTVTGDCNDGDATINPGATESSTTDGIDQNCDGAPEGTLWYTDADGDGWGDPALYQLAVEQPTGTSPLAADCNDSDASINPLAFERPGNSVDEDCNGHVAAWVYADGDGDGFGTGSPSVSDDGTAGTDQSLVAGDCNDDDSAINPDATEVADNDVDENCDSLRDYTFYADADGDGFGDATDSEVASTAPTGSVLDDTDCNDGDASINPGATETPDNAVDEDCNGLVSASVYRDADGDGFGTGSPTVSDDGTAGAGQSLVAGDCNDSASAINPSATEVADNAVDENCDGLFDSTWFRDADVDGYGNPLVTTIAPSLPTGYTNDSTDCDDANTAAHPGATEIAGNGVDEDCNGVDLPRTLSATSFAPAPRSTGYTAVKANKVTLTTAVVSTAPACTVGRAVTFTITGGTLTSPVVLSGVSSRQGVATAQATLAPGTYNAGLSTPATADCGAAASSAGGFTIVAVKPGKVK